MSKDPVGSLSEFCRALSELLSLEDGKSLSEAEWCNRSAQLQKRMSPSVSNQVDHEIWHYLVDLDIRLKDSAYGDIQKTSVRAFLESNT